MDTSNEGQELQRAMQAIRQKKHFRIQELQHETERLKDWREHVKSAPLTAFALSTTVGYLASRSIFARQERPEALQAGLGQNGKPEKSSLIWSLAAMAAPVVATAAQRYIVRQLSGILEGNHHGNL